VVSSFEFGIEPSGSIKYWETIEWSNNCGFSSGAQLHAVSLYLFIYLFQLDKLARFFIYHSVFARNISEANPAIAQCKLVAV
jgi:hypothetical protein